MPSPLNGLTDPAASPTTRYVGPCFGPTEPPMGMPPADRTGGRAAAASISQRSATGGRVAVEQVGGVDALEVAERREQPDADVDRAVAHREDPAVAGERVAVAVLHVERGLDPRLVVAGRLPVASGWRCRRATPWSGTCRAPGRSGCWRRRPPRRSGPQSSSGDGGVGGLRPRRPARSRGRSPGRWRRRPAAGWRRPPRRSAPPSSRGRAGAPRSRTAGTRGARATAAPAIGPARCSAGRRSGGTCVSSLAQAHVLRAA